jgi:hypothetical protein
LNLEDFASVADVLSAVAVVVSLIYVGIQVNDSTSAIRSAAASDATAAMQSWYLEMGRNRQASDVWLNAMRSPEPLPANEEFQFLMSMHAAILGMQNSYLLSKEGTLDAEFREAVTTAIRAVKALPGMDRYWRQRRGFFHTEFAKYVDGLLAQDAIETLDIYKKSDVASDH